jgi:MYXO-CTERM domain-containing protein
MKFIVLSLAAFVAASASADTILLDQRPSQAGGVGYTVGASAGFTVYQPFTVSDPEGWNLKRIWLDGFRVAGTGAMNVEIAADDASPALAATIITITNGNAGASAFVSGELDVILTGGGSYVMRVSANTPDVWTALFPGSSGQNSHSIEASGKRYDNSLSISTYFEGALVPAPAGLGLLGLGGLAGARRRR